MGIIDNLIGAGQKTIRESRADTTEKLRRRIDIATGEAAPASAPKAPASAPVEFFKKDPEREKKRKAGPPKSMLDKGADAGDLGKSWNNTFSS
jgi:hypothetical protein